MTTPDFYFQDGGSVLMIFPVTEQAHQWINDNVDLKIWQDANHFAINRSYFQDISGRIRSQGMTIKEI